MKVEFASQPDNSIRLQARIVDKGKLPADLEPVVRAGAEAARFSGKAAQVFETFVERDGKVVRLALVGAGDPGDEGRIGVLERAGAALAAKYRTSGETRLALDVADSVSTPQQAVAVLLGLRLRGWRHDAYRTTLPDEQKQTLDSVSVSGAPAGTEAAWNVEACIAEGVEFTKRLVTEPANVIYPESFVAACRERFEGTDAELTVLDEADMKALGMGALLGVAQGSARPPRLLAIRWNGGKPGEPPVAFVGKGVTFDTGGISIKPAAGMEDMKWDMGGAGAVAGTMLALVLRRAKANIVGVCGLVENMPDGNAQRPGDVVVSMSGKTIEVINTDAEGRLVLCDALTWTQKTYSPSTIVDLATLTGAIIVSLGHEHAGMFTNNDNLAAKLDAAGKATGDKLWRFPLGPAYDKMIDSPIADMKNVGPRYGGSITAAQFLQRYIENDTPWAHLDIAGTVWTDKPGATWDRGASGFGVRLLDRYVRDNCES
ncbi:putative cytosol aminopeptidase [Caenibius tardaugens NBRC 16725]|uniref:Probable cytosol aminopeptidase n=1 Tax=Caenibius tardaugens NBRC 16725 TaxID=1219035 RepID=U2ZXX8_9SPHN|nr:leucyl aminopeptidase [Caenibius tardaugens]AZI37372.1 leucyl aminopeptidase [Caenibius tardaugens NBRC 16725]GAD47368.1 putative cytosol aminopeptidase [Caenibius tardaugens NBRC 16725]